MFTSSLYDGLVSHTRIIPEKHSFNYKMFWYFLDLDKLDALCARFSFWSRNAFNLVSFRDTDYFPKAKLNGVDQQQNSLKRAIQREIYDQTGESFEGTIFILTQLRILNCAFNPVSFYFCFDTQDQLVYTIAYITNTPWDETHAYVFKSNNTRPIQSSIKFTHSVEFDKAFHISPFNPMDMRYHWQFMLRESEIEINMDCYSHSQIHMNAHMRLSKKPLSMKNNLSCLMRFPGQGVKVISAIYWQALKLWLKRVPFYSHPNECTSTQEAVQEKSQSTNKPNLQTRSQER